MASQTKKSNPFLSIFGGAAGIAYAPSSPSFVSGMAGNAASALGSSGARLVALGSGLFGSTGAGLADIQDDAGVDEEKSASSTGSSSPLVQPAAAAALSSSSSSSPSGDGTQAQASPGSTTPVATSLSVPADSSSGAVVQTDPASFLSRVQSFSTGFDAVSEPAPGSSTAGGGQPALVGGGQPALVGGGEPASATSAAPTDEAGGGTVSPARQSAVDPGTGVNANVAAPTTGQATTLNKIALENMKQGNPESEWGLSGDGDTNIQGFAAEMSVNLGQAVNFKIATDSTHYRIDIYRLGYYGGAGARKVGSIEQNLASAQVQPHPIVDYSLGLIDCGNWGVSASWQVPTDAVSGVYIAKLVREDGTAGENLIPFVVRDDSSKSNIVFQTSDTTWQAYNAWGGASLYYGEVPLNPDDMMAYMPPNCHCGLKAIGRAYAVSYNRPYITSTSPVGGPWDFVFGAEYSAIRWLEQNGYDISYISGVDTARSGNLLLNHDAFLSVGHDEYWSGEQRTNVEAARDAGVNLAFWSGNEVYWKVRWETSIDGSGTPYRTMVCYKETWANADIDPSSTGTGTWRDPRFADPGQKPENALTGTMFQVDSYRQDTISIPYDMSKLRFWRNTDVANLQQGQTATLVPNLLGYEWDSDVDNGFRPAGLVNLSLSTVSVDTYLYDYGSTVGPGTATHSLTMYRAASGALVFGAGTVYWSWGLDDNHKAEATPVDPNVQQAMVNMFADMGIQPTTLQASLVLATQSTDHMAPVSTITSPVMGASFVEGQRVTITGTAQDLGGGLIAGIEVSTDGGQTWHKATGRENWSYNWIAQASATYVIKSRAVDDSLNLETPSAGKQVTVSLPSTSSLWTFASKPAQETVVERQPVALGMQFQATTSGYVSGIRFYKGFYNAGDHSVDLWTSNGTLLASGVSVGETLSGWQTVDFASPVRITGGTAYIASYHTNGYYSVTDNYFDQAYTNNLLSVSTNGAVFAYGDTNVFPNLHYNGNYWVDVVFTPDPNKPPVAADDSGFTTARDATLALTFATLTANDTDPNGDALTIISVSNAVHGLATIDSQTKTVRFTPSTGYSGDASFTYTVSDGRGGTSSATVSLTVNQPGIGLTLFKDTDMPTGSVQNDNAALELGVKFVASTNGTITGIRFYKADGMTGVHTGSLWTSTGTLLATATFTGETASGWQTVTFSSPVSITAGTTYVASYHSGGAYVANSNYFGSAYVNGPLSALSSAQGNGNGVFVYGNGFPTGSYQATNYWVDVVYNQGTGGVNHVPVAANDNGFSTLYGTPLTISASALLANDSDPDGDPLAITGVGSAVNGTVAFDAQNNAVTFTPTAGYTGGASFSYTISDGRGGVSSATVSLSVGGSATAESLFSPRDTPAVAADGDPGSVELGVKFVASANGTITGLRYYKSAQDTGTHVGSLWTSTGTLLASATFTNETASGWQTVSFANPISISASTTYVASYHSNGHYAADANYFTTAHTSGSLTAPASGSSGGNGVYAYGSSSLFPNQSYNAANYWVDVLYERSSANNAPVAANDSGFQTNSGSPLVLQASALLANDSDPDGDPLTITGVGSPVNGTVSFDSQNNTVTFTPTTGYSGAASFSYTISDGRGGTASAQASLTVNDPNPAVSLFSASDTPARTYVADPNKVELGMKFQADVAGTVTGVRFYKGAQNTGTHNAHLWTATGSLLASATFANETASGWQTVTLAQPVQIQAGTTYVVSYSSNGNYSATSNFFGSSVTNGHLTGLSDALAGGNGVYAYGDSGLFPTNSYNKTNYYVDVLFKPQLAA
ncbi:DUF4082 domain-containing protein [Mesorhizobium sp. SP-1A]|uniref:DUF4082 domain-containing protein n=1 Tax=Mesorhizobium sp. SP-1A TaxID=3077840 RepID=UPI0028F7422B|nr:DUF4082 domain-containing protein [Mesorhizobium sp. SP-1A]